jgi:TolA-binding protein
MLVFNRLARRIVAHLWLLTLTVCWTCATSAPAQLKPEQAADMLLASARRAYNEKNYPFAAGRFKEFLGRHGNHREADAARYGMALCLLEGPDRDYAGAIEQLQVLVNKKEFPEHARAVYYLGLAQRGLGMRELAQADARPQEAAQRQNAARQRFEQAAGQFAAAFAEFAARAKEPPADAKDLPVEQEWGARARCELAEMHLRSGKVKEAQAAAEPFATQAVWGKSRYAKLGLYFHGFASFLSKDYLTAGRSLNRLAPFDDPVFGTHARYLVARVHHLSDERKEAADDYEGVIADHARHKQAAVEALRQPANFKNDPEEKVRLENLSRDPPPDHVARATLYLGLLQYEDGKFADALARLEAFSKQWPKSSLAQEAQLREGFCRVQLKQFPEAVRVLQPLADKEPRLADQALLWIARAQVGAADPNNAQGYGQALRTAMDTLRRAADRAQQSSSQDPEARERRGEILLELADTQQLAKQHREAAATYGQILNEKSLPNRDEEVLQRQAAALHLAGDYTESDKLCLRFQQLFPKSILLPAVLFRHAENAHFMAQVVEKTKAQNAAPEAARLHDEAARRYQVVLDRFPDFTYANLARYGVALAAYHKADFEKCLKTLEAIPQAERVDQLAQVPYLLADCLLRTAPTRADDALAAGKMEEQLKSAAELLAGYIGSQPNDPQAADALLKLGLCHQRLAGLFTQPPDRAKALGDARAAYEALAQRFPKHALQPQAVFERAKCIALGGDKGNAMNELQRFAGDPLRNSAVAPLALLQLSSLLREQHRAADAAKVLGQCRQQHEAALARDPERAAWVAVLQYQHGMALKEAARLDEARALFEQIAKQFAGRPEGIEALLRSSQCLREQGQVKLEAAQKARAAAGKPEQIVAADRAIDDGLRLVAEAVQYLEGQADQLKQKQASPDIRARMLYEAAWGCKTLADAQIAAARSRLQEELLKRKQAEAAKRDPRSPPPTSVPEISLSAIPVQPAELKVRALYKDLITSFPELPLAIHARFELAELLVERSEYDAALKLLGEALDKEPSPELTDKIRIRLGFCHAARKDAQAALAQFDAVIQNPKSPLAAEARYRAGEAMLELGNAAGAVKHLTPFRDQQPFQNLPGLSDRALLRLGQAYANLKQWDQSRQALETLVNRFGNSPWIYEARYSIGWAWQNQKQYDNAVTAYTQVTTGTATETAAKAQLQIGLCRLEQKRHPEAATALLVVPFTYDYPEWNAVALCEAARAFTELKQRDQAEKLLRRVIRDHPESKWAGVAKERLELLKDGDMP